MRPVILDTDIGSDVDDLLALVFLLRSSKLALTGVTTVYGDTELRARLTKRVCQIAGRDDVPVIPGATKPLSGRQVYWVGIEGEGIPGLEQAKIETGVSAEDFLIDSAARFKGELEVLAIGPLTNLANAIKKEPRFATWIKRLYMMGGAYYLDRPEHNIRCDCVAASAVFGSQAAITALGLDVTTVPQVREPDVARIEMNGSALSRLIVQQIRSWWIFRNTNMNCPHDPLAALAMEHPGLFRFQKGKVEVETEGPLYGLTRFTPGESNVEVASDLLPYTALEAIVERLAQS